MGQSTDRETIERVRRELGWDRPVLVQYAEYVGRLVKGDLGKSIQNGRPVAEDLKASVAARAAGVLAGATSTPRSIRRLGLSTRRWTPGT